MDKKNSKKVSFIFCSNDKLYENEAITYINSLHVPEGYEVEILSVEQAKSMTSGYNEAMEATDAKYKVYMHQDVFIINKNFIADMLRCFEDEKIGMLGLIGAEKLPESAIMWDCDRVGNIKTICDGKSNILCLQHQDKTDIEVEAIDGLLMITQYDIPWRDDIFTDWDFYDISQCQEFLKRGYKVVVPYMEQAWCIHDDGILNLTKYDKNREKFLKEYKYE